MASSSPAEARPVRTVANSRASTSSAAFMRASTSFSTVCMTAPLSGRRGDDRAHGLAAYDPRDVAGSGQVEHDDRQLVVHAERDRGGVHDLEAAVEHLDVRDPRQALGAG